MVVSWFGYLLFLSWREVFGNPGSLVFTIMFGGNQRFSPSFHSTGWFIGIPRSWIIVIPRILGSLIPYNLINQPGFWTLLISRFSPWFWGEKARKNRGKVGKWCIFDYFSLFQVWGIDGNRIEELNWLCCPNELFELLWSFMNVHQCSLARIHCRQCVWSSNQCMWPSKPELRGRGNRWGSSH